MPAELSHASDGAGLVITGHGIFSGDDILGIKREYERSASDPGSVEYWLVDLRRVTGLEIQTDEIKELVEIDRRLAKRMPRAAVAVVAPLDAVYGIARMWEIMADGIGWPTGVFRDFNDAELWVHARMAHISALPSDPPNLSV